MACDEKIAKLLLGAGADVNKMHHECGTPLSFFLMRTVQDRDLDDHTQRSQKCAKALLDAAADVNVVDPDTGNSVIQIVLSVMEDDIRHRADADDIRHQMLELLIGAGADVNKGENGNKPLHFAAKNGHEKCLGLLLRACAPVDGGPTKELTPLMAAALYDHPECVELLLNAGADVKREEKSGANSLFMAADMGQDECVELLLRAGSTIPEAKKDADFRYPLRPATLEALQSAGWNGPARKQHVACTT
jgi:ankyrin repeat protein